MRTLDAEELWRRFGAGDGSAFAELYSEHHHDVVRYCRSLLRDDEDAQDAAQGTWAAIWTKPDAARRAIPLRPWLFRVAHNEAISIIRRRRPHETLTDVDLPALDDVAEDAERRDRLAALRVDLVNLPERQRAALLSRELGGLGHAEIGDALGISAAAAKQTIYEARRALVEAESGRSMACDVVQRAISDGDGRSRRSRRLTAHLRSCAGCRTFAEALGRRHRDLRLLFPAPATLGLLARAAAGTGAGGAGGGLVTAGGGALATKVAVAAATIAVAGVGGHHALRTAHGAHAGASSKSRPPAAAPPRASRAPRSAGAVPAVKLTRSGPAPRRSARGATSAIRHERRAVAPHRDLSAASAPTVVAVAAPPPSLAKKAHGAEPPGQVKKADGAQPPGQVKKADRAQPPGQAKKTDAAVGSPPPASLAPGQAKKAARSEQPAR